MLVYPRQPAHHYPHFSQPSDVPSPSASSHSSRYPIYNSLPFAPASNTANSATLLSSPSPSSSIASEAAQKIVRPQLDAQSTLPTTHLSYPASAVDSLSDLDDDTYMTAAYDFQNPSIRVQHSTPLPQLSAPYASSPLSAISGVDAQDWGMYSSNNNHLAASPSLQAVSSRRGRGQGHQRGTSSSSVGSNGSPGQYAVGYPYVASCNTSPSPRTTKLDSFQPADEAQRPFSNHLPTPSQTPTQDSFLATTFPTYGSRPATSVESSIAAHMAFKQALLDQNATGEDDLPPFGHSGRQSVSSFGHESPATPHTLYGEETDDKYKMASNDVIRAPTVPKLDRTMTDIFQDELYNPANAAHIPAPQNQQQQQQQQQNPSLLSPYHHNAVTELLHQAEQVRAQSPASSISREVSPFRQGAAHAPQTYDGFASSHSNLRNSSAMRHPHQQHQGRGGSYPLKQIGKMEDTEPKTISPKEAMLDYRPEDDESQMPLFPSVSSAEYDTQYGNGATQSAVGNNGIAQTGLVGSGPLPPQSTFAFTHHPVMPVPFSNLPQFTASHPYRTASTITPTVTEPTPDFPAHLTSMESSASEAGPADSSSNHGADIQRPSSTLADSGTYSCTYHGCVLRFDTPQKLQRHKRESHRNTANSADPPAIGSGMTSAALLARNSQAGPHKCERINPTTGKPCNTIFSRPYDLTRHEDTIHNIRKQKVRCALCVEEKTFSRNDALTRHMRVVHPEVDFPGKHRRRGGNHD